MFHLNSSIVCCDLRYNLLLNESLKYNILNMRIYNVNRYSFVTFKTNFHNWLTNKSKSCKDLIQDNYNNNYGSWLLKNIFSVILPIYINLSNFTRSRLTERLFSHDRSTVDLINLCRLSILNRFCVIVSIFF